VSEVRANPRLVIMTTRNSLGWCQKPDRKGGLVSKQALPYGRASDTNEETLATNSEF
jgi:hypothetical protein